MSSSPSQTPPARTTVFIGGVLDEFSQIVSCYHHTHQSDYPNSRFFRWFERGKISHFIKSQSPQTKVALVGHSFGASTALKLAQSHPVDLLITVDGVGPFYKLPKTPLWVNILATHKNGTRRGDWIAWCGRKWSDLPKDFAHEHISSPFNHADFKDMLNTGYDGLTPVDHMKAGGFYNPKV